VVLQGGGVNFDAKIEEIQQIWKISLAHIGGADTFAKIDC
jgi:xylose isomerase